MASFQSDFNIGNIKGLISKWQATVERREGCDAQSYYFGNNVTIAKVKKMFFSDRSKTQIDNNFVANYHIGYSKYHDIVSQKVDTLLDEIPTISGVDDAVLAKNLGYALKRASIKASNFGRAFIFAGFDGTMTVFDTENCIPFYDDENAAKIMALIRYWESSSIDSTNTTTFAEVYEQDGMSVYSAKGDNDFSLLSAKVPYRMQIVSDAIGSTDISDNPSRIPIVELDNNDDKMSDFTPNVRSKIDQIDILQSGFANNVEDFSEIYWVVKNGSGMKSDEFEDFVASINKTKKVLLSGEPGALDVDMKQGVIPYQARQQLIDTLKKDLTEDTGVLDTATLTGSALTTTAIKAATLKLRQRVSDFEWQAYNAAMELVGIYSNVSDYDIDFTELLIDNETEIIDNAIKIKDTISKRSYLNLLKRANYIQDVDKEIDQLNEDSMDKFKLEDNNPDNNPDNNSDNSPDNNPDNSPDNNPDNNADGSGNGGNGNGGQGTSPDGSGTGTSGEGT